VGVLESESGALRGPARDPGGEMDRMFPKGPGKVGHVDTMGLRVEAPLGQGWKESIRGALGTNNNSE